MDFKKVEEKWQKKWEEKKIFQVKESIKKKKFYCLTMFPYPSGSGLHVGHAFNYVIGDVFARFKIMQGYKVLHPMGYDALGLPAENAAIQEGKHPEDYTDKSTKKFIEQQKALGLTYDWNRMVMTSKPDYYKWDQWIFLKMFEKGLAYKKKSAVNWCPECQTVLANEQVHNGRCWRHEDTEIEIKHLDQWYLKITDYVEELNNFSKLKEWPELIKKLQENWIGKSHGSEIIFEIDGKEWPIFTTRADTVYGVTFMVISAQHPKLMELIKEENKKDVEEFLRKLKSVSEKEFEEMEKEGVFTGAYAVHPLTKERIPVYAGNFVVADYGSGMVMAVPAHDQRDFEFAKKYNIPIKIVIQPKDKKLENLEKAYTDKGVLVNSGDFNGMDSEKAKEEITNYLEKKKLGKKTINYKLRDWLVSRQRYWGTPIPIVYCSKCGIVPVPEKELPIELPRDVKFGRGNPLMTNSSFVNCKCPKCKSKAKRETDTMDTFVNSSWYYLRYCDSKNKKKIFDSKKAGYWCPVDLYVGGKEHACMHLIYIRFYTKFLRDLGLINIDEPAVKLFNQGYIYGEDGRKMSKSYGNTIDPLDTIKKYSTDALRLYLVSVAAPDSDFNWSDKEMQGVYKFVNKVAEEFDSIKKEKSSKRLESSLNKAVKEITEDIENLKYNLAVIKIRALFDVFLQEESSKNDVETFLKLICPFCPHIAEELWARLGNKEFISLAKWPKFDAKKIDPKVDASFEFLEDVRRDVYAIKKLVNKEVNEITLFISDKWKYDFMKKMFNTLKETRNLGEVIKKVMDKEHSADIARMVPKMVANPERVVNVILNQKDEFEILMNNKSRLEEEFDAKINIVKAEDSQDNKARNAMPFKPAILLE